MKQKINNGQITSMAIASILLIGSISMTTPAFAHSQGSSLTFGFNSPVVEGTPATMEGEALAEYRSANGGNLEHLAGPINGGSVQIQQGVDEFDSPVSSCYSVDHFNVITTVQTNASGEYSYDFPTDGLGGQMLVFRAELLESGGSHNIQGEEASCLPLVINEGAECEGDVQITAIDSSVNQYLDQFGYTIKVTACTEIENIKIQGGSNGWSQITDFIATPDDLGQVDVKPQPKKNTVYSWKIESLAENDMVTFEVVMSPIKEISCGQTVQLNGGWSVAYNLPDDDTKYKTEYSSPLTWTKTCV